MRIAVVVLNYNGIEETLACLDSLRKCDIGKHQVSTIVVDNNSADNSPEKLSKLREIHLIKNKENLGFAGGMNVGIQYALDHKADWILILNNDTFVEKSFLLNLIEAGKMADIISPIIYFAPGFEFHKKRYNENQLGKVIWYAGGEIDWQNILGLHLHVDEVDIGKFKKGGETDFATGACMFVRRQVFEKIGLFDERYFLYLEDMDFCMRAKLKGFRVYFEPKSIIWHKNASSTGGSGSTLQDYYITRNRLLFALKFAPWRTKLAVFKQVLGQFSNPVKRQALIDFATYRFGKGTTK